MQNGPNTSAGTGPRITVLHGGRSQMALRCRWGSRLSK